VRGGPAQLRHCGAYVADACKELIGDHDVRCLVRELDQYDRRISTCEMAGEDLSKLAALRGPGTEPTASSRNGSCPFAAAARRGLWQTTFEMPWDYRAHRWEVAAQATPEGCPIEGNVNRDGERIFHTAWGSQW
jgi:endonuclease YncB( thermonuclease family)